MKKKEIAVNQNAQLIVKKGSFVGTYSSRIEDIGEDYIVLAMPIVQGQLIPLHVNTEVEIIVFSQGAGYGFISHVTERKNHPIPLLKVNYPQTTKKVQRRNFVRLPTMLQVDYVVKDKSENKTSAKGKTIDISGGGVCLMVDERLEIGNVLNLSITLPDDVEIPAIGRVVRTNYPVSQDNLKKHIVGIHFKEITEQNRDKIISYIFQRQREMRRKGLL